MALKSEMRLDSQCRLPKIIPIYMASVARSAEPTAHCGNSGVCAYRKNTNEAMAIAQAKIAKSSLFACRRALTG